MSGERRTKKLKAGSSTIRRWEFPNGSGISISEFENKTRGKVYGTSFLVVVPSSVTGQTGFRNKEQFKSLEEAERFAEDRLLAYRSHGRSLTALPPAAQKEALVAWTKLSEHGIGFIEAAEAAVKVLRPSGGRFTVSQVIAELYALKEEQANNGSLRQRSLENFRRLTHGVNARFGDKQVSTITEGEVVEWLRDLSKRGTYGKPLGPTSIRHHAVHLSAVFKYAVEKRYCHENPCHRIPRVTRSALYGKGDNDGGIRCLTVAEAGRLLAAANEGDRRMLAPVVLRLFCGIRTDEVLGLDWSHVRWQDSRPSVTIPATVAKGRSIRNVTLSGNAVEWLTLCPDKSGRITPQHSSRTHCAAFTRLLNVAGVPERDQNGVERDNITRHSFGSYHFARFGDSVRTASEMGHKQGDNILFAHYRALVSEQDGERYFELRPGTAASGEVIPMVAAG